tara:strand:- start:437 stop:1900 length:1464 start_codon:yes stop_codon:yes gene_type:complete
MKKHKYIAGGWVWLRKSDYSPTYLNHIRRRLTCYPTSTSEHSLKEPPPIRLYEDRQEVIGVPRGWFIDQGICSEGSESVVERVSDGMAINPSVKSLMTFEGPFKEQGEALAHMQAYMKKVGFGGFLLQAGCGFGKTNTALELAYRNGRRTLILVHKEFFLRQWKERIETFFTGAKIGYIKQKTCDFEGCDFVIGMLQSISRDDGAGSKYDPAMYEAFGMIISDECHRIGAQTWSDLVPRFTARWRVGLTATPRRKDDAEMVFFTHIGPIIYRAQTSALVPEVRVLETQARLKGKRMYGRFKPADSLSHTEVLGQLVENSDRNRLIAEVVARAVSNGRKVMIISERLKHLDSLKEDFLNELLRLDYELNPDVEIDYMVGSRSEAQLKRAEGANLILATKQMVEEGLDVPAIDVLVLATPMSDVEQTVGRVRRHCKPNKSKCPKMCPWRAHTCKEKPHPIVVDVHDLHIPQTMRKVKRRNQFYDQIRRR